MTEKEDKGQVESTGARALARARRILWAAGRTVRGHWPLPVAAAVIISAAAWGYGKMMAYGVFTKAFQSSPERAFMPPGEGAPWGTDQVGTDWLARVVNGVSGSLVVAVVAWLIVFFAGGVAGVLIHRLPARIRKSIWQLSRVPFLLPAFLLVAVLSLALEGTSWDFVLAISVFGALIVARTVEESLSHLEQRAYFVGAVASGIKPSQLWAGYYLATTTSVALVAAWSVMPAVFLWDAAFHFVVADGSEGMWTLGTLMAEARRYFLDAPWLMVYPGLMLCVLCLIARLVKRTIAYVLRRTTGPVRLTHGLF